jgi:hypothetical protein
VCACLGTLGLLMNFDYARRFHTPVELGWNCLDSWIGGLFIPCPLIGFTSQYSNSPFASWARSRHLVSKAENRFLESTRPLELIYKL